MPSSIYDVIIIGSGPGGYTAAIRAGQFGLKTALIEKDNVLGGTCLHVGCIPTKSMLFNAELWDHLKEAKEYGIELTGEPKLNWGSVLTRKSKIVTKHTKGLDFLMRKNKVEVISGWGKLTGPAKDGIHSVSVSTKPDGGDAKILQGKNVIVATGSGARMIPGLEHAEFFRFGQMHRNTYINAPALLGPTLELRNRPAILFAGQISGVEGYVESIATGLVAGRNAAARALGDEPRPLPRETALGSLCHYISSADPANYQPANIAFDLLPPLDETTRSKLRHDKKARHAEICRRALESIEEYLHAHV